MPKRLVKKAGLLKRVRVKGKRKARLAGRAVKKGAKKHAFAAGAVTAGAGIVGSSAINSRIKRRKAYKRAKSQLEKRGSVTLYNPSTGRFTTFRKKKARKKR